MKECSDNLLIQPLIHAAPCGPLSLPGVLAALARDAVESFPALRPHQMPAWHMFLVQLAALALHRGGQSDMPEDEEAWCRLLRGLTPDFPEDEPWRLAVSDWLKPAFLQPPVPVGLKLDNPVSSADALDLLITAKNHDLKQAVAQNGAADDWVFSLVSLQTGEGYGGAGNQGIARMNGGSSSRAMMALAPLPPANAKSMAPRPGPWFHRDVLVLLQAREKQLEDNEKFPSEGGIALVWQELWPEGAQLRLSQLDIWFIEICRRIRLIEKDGQFTAVKGTSKATRIDAKNFKGALDDPYTPVHKTEDKSLTLGEGDFDYKRLTDLLFSGDWVLPLLAKPAAFEAAGSPQALVCAALSRGNSKTDGFKTRIVPVGHHATAMVGDKRQQLHELAQTQIQEISGFDKAISVALALAAAGGERDMIKKEHYARTTEARVQFDRAADLIFFPHLWARFEARDGDEDAGRRERHAFQSKLKIRAEHVFEGALPTIPCAAIFRPRAEARARNAFNAMIRKSFPLLFQKDDTEVHAYAS